MDFGHSLRGVEEHRFRECIDSFMDNVQQLLNRHVDVALSDDRERRAQALVVLEVVLDGLRDDLNEALAERIAMLKSTT